MLEIKDLHVSASDKMILDGLDLVIKQGEFHVLMGPNGSGKTTLGNVIMGHPKTKIISGDILIDGQSILDLKTNERAKMGLFMQFQNPVEIDGVGFVNFVNSAKGTVFGAEKNIKEFMAEIKKNAKELKFEEVTSRQLNKNFSGGEKKKAEMIQMSMLKPKIAILDEPDSGLDIDAVKLVANSINSTFQRDDTGLLVITHYSRILNYMSPKFAHILAGGKIVREGGMELIKKLEEEGYEPFLKGDEK